VVVRSIDRRQPPVTMKTEVVAARVQHVSNITVTRRQNALAFDPL
jgi:hypothetical protein